MIYEKYKTYIIIGLISFIAGYCLQLLSSRASYTVYESELTRLNQIITGLETNWNQAKESLQTSKKQLQEQEKQLQELKEQLEILKGQIAKSENLSKQLADKLSQVGTSLETLEESFQAYKKEAEARIRKLTIQRNVFIVASLILGVIVL